jgi:hypothetical protein
MLAELRGGAAQRVRARVHQAIILLATRTYAHILLARCFWLRRLEFRSLRASWAAVFCLGTACARAGAGSARQPAGCWLACGDPALANCEASALMRSLSEPQLLRGVAVSASQPQQQRHLPFRRPLRGAAERRRRHGSGQVFLRRAAARESPRATHDQSTSQRHRPVFVSSASPRAHAGLALPD